MAKEASKTVVGIFVISAIALIIVGVVTRSAQTIGLSMTASL